MTRLHIGLLALALGHCDSAPPENPRAQAGNGPGAADVAGAAILKTSTPADESPAVATSILQATAVLSQSVFTSSLVLKAEDEALVSVFKDKAPEPLFAHAFNEENCDSHYLVLDAVENRQDILVVRFGCVAGEDKKRIHGTAIVLRVRADDIEAVWSGTETTRILRDECLDESYIEVLGHAEGFVQITRVTQEQDRVTDPKDSEFECPIKPRTETLVEKLPL